MKVHLLFENYFSDLDKSLNLIQTSHGMKSNCSILWCINSLNNITNYSSTK